MPTTKHTCSVCSTYYQQLEKLLSEQGLTSHLTHNRSFWKWLFTGNRLHWYWQPKTRKQNTTYTRNTKKQKKTATANKTNYATVWYAFYDLRLWNGVGPTLIAPEPARGFTSVEIIWTLSWNRWMYHIITITLLPRLLLTSLLWWNHIRLGQATPHKVSQRRILGDVGASFVCSQMPCMSPNQHHHWSTMGFVSICSDGKLLLKPSASTIVCSGRRWPSLWI